MLYIADSDNNLHKKFPVHKPGEVHITLHHHNIGSGSAFLMERNTNFDFKLKFSVTRHIPVPLMSILTLRKIKELSL